MGGREGEDTGLQDVSVGELIARVNALGVTIISGRVYLLGEIERITDG